MPYAEIEKKMFAFWLLLWCFGQICCAFGSECDPVARVGEGILRGKRMTTRGGRSFHAFLGIPFARPPIGELRFKVPTYRKKLYSTIFVVIKFLDKKRSWIGLISWLFNYFKRRNKFIGNNTGRIIFYAKKM